MGELSNEGWHISAEGYNLLTQNGNIKNKKSILTEALNTDIKDFGEAFLNVELKRSKTEKIILQIQKIRNIAAPKNKEESQAAPRMLKLTLTDGHTNCTAIEISNISSLSRTNTPPGSKLLINNARIASNCIFLQPNCCSLLGGQVPALCEKWELMKNISESVRTSSGVDGPPPWVNFGEKIISATSNEPFKSLASKTPKETTNEFDVHRQDAIAVASSGAIKKVFGGGSKTSQNTMNNRTTTQKFNNNKKPNNGRNTQSDSNNETGRGFRGKREIKDRNMDKPQKPPEKISLFDFLEDKLPVRETTENNSIRTLEDNNYSSYRNYPDNSPRFQKQSFHAPPRRTTNNETGSKNNYYGKSNFNKNARQTTNTSYNHVDPMESVTKNMETLSVNTQFASRSLKQHLNLGGNKNDNLKLDAAPDSKNWNWTVGDLCMAKYWEDGKYYNASIINLTERTCVVKFNGYGNVEEVLKTDCIPITNAAQESHLNTNYRQKNFRGSSDYHNRKPQYSNNRTYNKNT